MTNDSFRHKNTTPALSETLPLEKRGLERDFAHMSLELFSKTFCRLPLLAERSRGAAFCLSLLIVSSIDNLAFSQNPPASSSQGVVKSLFACSELNVDTLTTYLLRDLPSYTNRVTQRARRLSRSAEVYSYMLVAGRPEFTPLPLNPGIYTADASESADLGVEQVFFTTLSRQYIRGQAVELQEFHWLLLTKTETSWRLVMMFTQTGSFPKQQPPSPPRDSSKGTVAQAINLWLRDCQVGSVRMGGVNKSDRILPK
jgi:hypothetical protein